MLHLKILENLYKLIIEEKCNNPAIDAALAVMVGWTEVKFNPSTKDWEGVPPQSHKSRPIHLFRIYSSFANQLISRDECEVVTTCGDNSYQVTCYYIHDGQTYMYETCSSIPAVALCLAAINFHIIKIIGPSVSILKEKRSIVA